MVYRREASPLHAARGAAGGAWCCAVAAAALAGQHPLVLVALLGATLAAAAAARVGRDVARVAAFVVPLAILATLVNPFVTREGLTVFLRLGEVPPFGNVDLTVEALVYGGVLGLRLVAVVAAFALFTAAVDPDEVLRLFRRVSFRSALAASLAVRLVPVLARDGRRLADAQRCRPQPPQGTRARVAILRAVASGALDRALDVAATLEVRGYGTASRARGRRLVRPWSRHDLAFAASALALVALTAWMRITGTAGFDPYPLLDVDVGAAEVLVVAAVLLIALAPFADRRGIER